MYTKISDNYEWETISCPQDTFGAKIHFFRNQLKIKKNKPQSDMGISSFESPELTLN